jgi:hypothetical protein
MGDYYTSGLYAAQWAETIVDRFADRIEPQAQQETLQGEDSERNAAKQVSSFISPLELSLKPFDAPATPVEVVNQAAPLTLRSLNSFWLLHQMHHYSQGYKATKVKEYLEPEKFTEKDWMAIATVCGFKRSWAIRQMEEFGK